LASIYFVVKNKGVAKGTIAIGKSNSAFDKKLGF
jgi:hypothetical protein